jgi:hypothetical protein
MILRGNGMDREKRIIVRGSLEVDYLVDSSGSWFMWSRIISHHCCRYHSPPPLQSPYSLPRP